MERVEIVMGLVQQDESYHLQLRNGAGQAGALGLIGCFGGKIEHGESPEEAVCRELREESYLTPMPEELEFLGEVNVDSERHGRLISVHARIYRIVIDGKIKVKAREGQLVTMTRNEIRSKMDKLTPATRACFEQLIQ